MMRKREDYIISLIALSIDVILVFIGVLLYTKFPYFKTLLSEEVVSFIPILAGCFIACAFFHFSFDLFYQRKYISTSYKAFSFLFFLLKNLKKNSYTPIGKEYTNAFFITLVKLLFVPMMLQFTINNFGALINIVVNLDYNEIRSLDVFLLFNHHFYPLLLSICFFVDTVIYLFAYLLYSKALGNTVRSVETSFSGWLSVLLCYPPLNVVTGYFLPAKYNDYIFFWSEKSTFFIRILLLALIIIYTTATLNLGWKSSNLTNRGIVSHGVYSLVRHPAYIAKNLFWWITIIPVIPFYPSTIIYMAGVSFIYYMRVVTEERHLRKDPEYKSYCQKVKYRFIPKVI